MNRRTKWTQVGRKHKVCWFYHWNPHFTIILPHLTCQKYGARRAWTQLRTSLRDWKLPSGLWFWTIHAERGAFSNDVLVGGFSEGLKPPTSICTSKFCLHIKNMINHSDVCTLSILSDVNPRLWKKPWWWFGRCAATGDSVVPFF